MLANSSKQDLKKHCKAVGIVAGNIAEQITKGMDSRHMASVIVSQARLAGYMHDIGKAEKSFQEFIAKKVGAIQPSEELEESRATKKPFHNEVSWQAIHPRLPKAPYVSYAVYHHHTPTRNGCAETLSSKRVPKEVAAFMDLMLKEHNEEFGDVEELFVPEFVTSKFATRYPSANVVLACLVQADRWVSAMGESLNTIELDQQATFCSQYNKWISTKSCLSKHLCIDKLYYYQRDLIEEISENIHEHTFIVEGPTGCGKTITSLSFCNLFDRRRDFFVAPRNTVCHSVYNTIAGDLEILGMPSRTRELITANQKQAQVGNAAYQESETVVINIDSVLNSYYKHFHVMHLIDLFTEPMVVDEFHELNQSTAILAIFRDFIATRHMLGSKTILISATPVDILKDLSIGVGGEAVIPYKAKPMPISDKLNSTHTFKIISEFPDETDENTWYRFNTIRPTQEWFIENVNDKNREGVIYHSKYDDTDKEAKIEAIIKMYGKESVAEKLPVATSPVTECSLNISYKNAVLELATPQSLIQSLGRVTRFGEDHDSTVSIVVSEKSSPGNNAYYNLVYTQELARLWKQFVVANIKGSLTKSQIISLVKEFERQNKIKVDEWIDNCIDKSIENVSRVKNKRGRSNKLEEFVVGAGGLRGDSGFIGVWFTADSYKRYVFSSAFDRKHADDHWDGGRDAKSCLPAQSFFKHYQDSKINFNYRELYKGGLGFDRASKLARKESKAIPFQGPGAKPWAFDYDSNPSLLKNVGIIKLTSSADDASVIEDES